MRFLSSPWWWGAFSHRSPSLSLGSTSWCRESHHYQHDHESEYLLASAVSVWDLSRLDRSCVCSNCNAALVSLGIDVMTQIVAAAVSLALVSISYVGCVDRPSYTLPSVVVWATVSSTAWYCHCHLRLYLYLFPFTIQDFIFYELKDSKPLIKEAFRSEQILVFPVGAGVLATFLARYISCFGFTSTALQRSWKWKRERKNICLRALLGITSDARECIIIIVIRYCETNQNVGIKWILFVKFNYYPNWANAHERNVCPALLLDYLISTTKEGWNKS